MNIISAENFKITKDKSLKILLLISIVTFFGLSCLTTFNVIESQINGAEKVAMMPPYYFQEYYVFLVIFAGVLAGTYVVSEFDKGTIRNALGTGTSKSSYYFSKLYSQLIACVVLTVVSVIATTIAVTIFMGWSGSIDSHNILNLFAFFGVVLLYLFSYNSMFLMIAFLIRNVGGVIAICIVYAMVENLIFQLLMMTKLTVLNTIAQNMPIFILSNLTGYVESDTILTMDFAKIIISALIIIVITSSVGLITFIKTDVK